MGPAKGKGILGRGTRKCHVLEAVAVCCVCLLPREDVGVAARARGQAQDCSAGTLSAMERSSRRGAQLITFEKVIRRSGVALSSLWSIWLGSWELLEYIR